MTVTTVKTPEEALAVALIRNECRQWMTGNQKAIDVGGQLKFFRKTPAGLTLLIVRDRGLPVGYAVLKKKRGGGNVLTGGLAKPFRGMGLGRRLFEELIRITKQNASLSVLKTNRRAVRLYKSLGFVTDSETKRMIFMHYDTTT